MFYISLTLLLYAVTYTALSTLTPLLGTTCGVMIFIATTFFWRGLLIERKLIEAVRFANEDLAARIATRTQKDYVELYSDYIGLLGKYHDLWEYCEKLREFSVSNNANSTLNIKH
jgi:hypothetical protein